MQPMSTGDFHVLTRYENGLRYLGRIFDIFSNSFRIGGDRSVVSVEVFQLTPSGTSVLTKYPDGLPLLPYFRPPSRGKPGRNCLFSKWEEPATGRYPDAVQEPSRKKPVRELVTEITIPPMISSVPSICKRFFQVPPRPTWPLLI